MMKVPISVVIPCYNSERFIREAIESVQSQTFPVDEIIVVDNNCTDKTAEIAEEMGVIVVKQPAQGLPQARNKGISIAKNEWIAILDSDDVWIEDKIEHQWKAIEMFPDARIVSCHYLFLNSYEGAERQILDLKPRMKPQEVHKDVILGESFNYAPQIKLDLYSWFTVNASTAIIHREIFEQVGVFDESLPFREEVEFFMRALSVSKIATVSKHLVYIRIHPFSMGHDFAGLMNYHNLVIKRMERFPDNYAKDAVEFNREWFKKAFLHRGHALNHRLQKNNDQSL